MKKTLSTLLALMVVAAAPAYGQDDVLDREREKRGQTGMQFLSISVSPRAAAMGDAMAAIDAGTSTAMFYNPAAMAGQSGGHLGVSTVQWIADISYNNASVAFSPSGGRYGVFGVSIVAVDYGDLERTIRVDGAESGYRDLGSFSPSALAVGVGYARSLSDRFSVGGNVRYVRQDLGESTMNADGLTQGNTASTPVFDFGVLYRTGFRSMNLAVTARNFSPAVTYEEESFETPLNLNIGLSADVLDVFASSASMTNHAFLVSAEAGHPRSYSEQFRVGGEYQFMGVLALRAGYVFPSDEQGINVGGGLNLGVSGFRFSADYAYSQFGDLGNVNRIGVQLGF